MSEEIKKQEGGEEMPISHVEINQDGVAEVEKPTEDNNKVEEAPKEAEGEKKQDDEKEEEKPAAQTNGDITEEKEEGQEEEGETSAAAKTASTTTSDDAPLTKILEGLDQLSEEQQQVVKNNLERISEYPRELPLSQSWTLHFSDTSGASKSSSAAATKDAYTEGINPVFVATTVPGLCGQLKAFKKAVRPKRAKPTDPDGLGLNRPGMNLHFFRTGISPTWEDPYNEKGGRLTISPPAQFFDPIYERLVLLLAGSSLELGTSELLQTEGPAPSSKRPPTPGPPQEGMIMGVVASRRARGDRIELWIGGKAKREPTPGDWIDRLKEVLADQLEMPELRTSKYKKHF